MRTVAETPIFIRYASEIWSDEERQAFITFIATNPEAGDIVRGSEAAGRSVGPAAAPASAAEPESSTSLLKTRQSGY